MQVSDPVRMTTPRPDPDLQTAPNRAVFAESITFLLLSAIIETSQGSLSPVQIDLSIYNIFKNGITLRFLDTIILRSAGTELPSISSTISPGTRALTSIFTILLFL